MWGSIVEAPFCRKPAFIRNWHLKQRLCLSADEADELLSYAEASPRFPTLCTLLASGQMQTQKSVLATSAMVFVQDIPNPCMSTCRCISAFVMGKSSDGRLAFSRT